MKDLEPKTIALAAIWVLIVWRAPQSFLFSLASQLKDMCRALRPTRGASRPLRG